MHGKPFDDLDAIKLRVELLGSGLVEVGASYGIYSQSGVPLVGLVANDKQEIKIFNHPEWL